MSGWEAIWSRRTAGRVKRLQDTMDRHDVLQLCAQDNTGTSNVRHDGDRSPSLLRSSTPSSVVDPSSPSFSFLVRGPWSDIFAAWTEAKVVAGGLRTSGWCTASCVRAREAGSWMPPQTGETREDRTSTPRTHRLRSSEMGRMSGEAQS